MIRALVFSRIPAKTMQGCQINPSLFSWKIQQMVHIVIAFCLINKDHKIWENSQDLQHCQDRTRLALIGAIVSAILEKLSQAHDMDSTFEYEPQFNVLDKTYSLEEWGEYMKLSVIEVQRREPTSL